MNIASLYVGDGECESCASNDVPLYLSIPGDPNSLTACESCLIDGVV